MERLPGRGPGRYTPTRLEQENDMIGIVATLKVQEGKAAEFEAIFTELAQKVRANEPGNLCYQLTRSRADPNTYKVLELYQDEAAVTAHGQSEYFRDLGRKMGPCMGGRPEIETLDGVG
jgi:quinol monooxygenase YgiN